MLCGVCEESTSKEEVKNDESNNKEYGLADVGKIAFPDNMAILNDPNIFVGDTGVTSDTTPYEIGMSNFKNAVPSDDITEASRSSIKATKIGDLSAVMCDKHGNEKNIVKVKDLTVMPTTKFNLLGISKRLREGWKLYGDNDSISLKKNNNEIKFDIKVTTAKGALYCAYLKREVGAIGTNDKPNKGKKISINTAHEIFGHADEETTRKIAKELGYELTRGTMKPCVSCAIAKAKQKNVPKLSKHEPSKQVNGRVYLDISTVKKPKDVKVTLTKPNWRLIVDEKTRMKINDFYETKNGMVEPTCEKFNRWEQNDMGVRTVRLDNAGENKKLEKRAGSVDWKLNLTFEFTARDTPQQNSLVEVGFATLAN